MAIEALQQVCEKEYSLKQIYNIYVKIVQAHIIYQPSKAKAIIAMPFDWLEVQNLLEDYLKKHGADFDALSKEYIYENAEDDYLPSAQSEQRWIPCSERLPNHYEYIKNNGLFNVSDGVRSYSELFDICDTKMFGEPTMLGFRVDYAVTAWMPLPEPYKGEN